MFASLESLVRAPYYDRYLKLVRYTDLERELRDSLAEALALRSQLQKVGLSHRYGPDKWTVAEVIIHCIETELIFNYRALTIAREPLPVDLPGFDENIYVPQASISGWSLDDLLSYLEHVRQSTIFLSRSMSAAQMGRLGKANHFDIQVEALFYISSAHLRHHMDILQTRYLV